MISKTSVAFIEQKRLKTKLDASNDFPPHFQFFDLLLNLHLAFVFAPVPLFPLNSVIVTGPLRYLDCQAAGTIAVIFFVNIQKQFSQI